MTRIYYNKMVMQGRSSSVFSPLVIDSSLNLVPRALAHLLEISKIVLSGRKQHEDSKENNGSQVSIDMLIFLSEDFTLSPTRCYFKY